MALAATAANKALVEGKTVILEKDVSETDQFDRILRDVWVLHDGAVVLVGLELVRTGFAQVTTYPPDVKYVDLLTKAQDSARTAAIGLWGSTAAATVAPTRTPTPTASPRAPVSLVGGATKCHPSYSPCLPIVDDLNCPDVKAMGKAPVTIKGPDDYRLDRDGDGLGCE
jgi:micrococcal nuclease